MKKKQTKSLIKTLLIVVLIACVSFGVYVTFTPKADTYTAQDINNAYKEGYNKGSLGNREEIAEFVNDLEKRLEDSLKKAEELEIDNIEKANIINEALEYLEWLQASYTQTFNELQYENEISNDRIKFLTETLENLKSDIEYLQGIIDNYVGPTQYVCTFIVYNGFYGLKVVEENSFASIEQPENTNFFEFAGWTLDGENIIDLASYPITENTTFIAKSNTRFTVTYKYKNVLNQTVTYTTQEIIPGGHLVDPGRPSGIYYWYYYNDEGLKVNVTDFSSVTVWKNLEIWGSTMPVAGGM